MKIDNKNRKTMAKWLIAVVTVCIIIYLAVSNLSVVGKAVAWVYNLFFPLILGFIFALILNVPMCFFERHLWPRAKKKFSIKIRRPLALILSVLLIFGVLAGVIVLVIPQLVEAVKIIIETLTKTVNDLSSINKKNVAESALIDYIINLDWKEIQGSLEGLIESKGVMIMNGAVGTVGSFIGGIVDFFVALVFSVYILVSKERLKRIAGRLISAWLPEKVGNWGVHASYVASVNFRNFIAGQTIEALILGLLCMLGMLILRIPYAPTIGALVGVTALVPVVGAFIGGGVGAFMIVTESPVKALVFVIFLIVLQQIEGNLIYPKMMGDRIKLPAMWVLAAVTVGGALGGPIGMLFAVPLMSTLYVLIREETEKREAAKAPLTEEIIVNNEEDNEVQ